HRVAGRTTQRARQVRRQSGSSPPLPRQLAQRPSRTPRAGRRPGGSIGPAAEEPSRSDHPEKPRRFVVRGGRPTPQAQPGRGPRSLAASARSLAAAPEAGGTDMNASVKPSSESSSKIAPELSAQVMHVLEEYLAQLERGTPPPPEELLAQHP